MYQIILYNHGKRLKTFGTFEFYGDAIKEYKDLLAKNKVFLPKEVVWNGNKTDYELALTAPSKNKAKEYYRDELGGLVKIKPKGDFVIKQIERYLVEDRFKNKITGKYLTFRDLIRYLLRNKGLTYVITSINNKLVVERFENEDIDLFVLKNRKAANLLCDTLKEFNNANNLTNFIYFDNPSFETKSRLYELLEQNGVSRDYMYRIQTH